VIFYVKRHTVNWKEKRQKEHDSLQTVRQKKLPHPQKKVQQLRLWR
jgi:hypothetical protein